jgi:phosphate transport system ATP-binding protein
MSAIDRAEGAAAIAGTAAAEATGTYPPLRVQGLEVYFGEKRVVHGIDFDVSQNSVFTLIGPSGCGKTTILRSLNQLSDLVGARVVGRILLDGQDTRDGTIEVTSLRRRVGMVFQQPNPFPMSIFENVSYALREQASRRPKRKTLEEPVQRALEHAGLWDEVKDSLDRSALGLSGGQQQRLCIARVLAAQPEVLLMDEPCSALDPRSTMVIEELMLRLKKELTFVIVTHNMQQARRIGDRVAFMLNGDLVESGSAQKIFENADRQETRDYVAGVFG